MLKKCQRKKWSKLVHHMIKGSFNCIVAAAYASIIPVSMWTGESLDCILHC